MYIVYNIERFEVELIEFTKEISNSPYYKLFKNICTKFFKLQRDLISK